MTPHLSPLECPPNAVPSESRNALQSLFEAEGIALFLKGGEPLMADGLRSLCHLRAGRIAEIRTFGEITQVVAVHRPGALIGGAELLTGASHGASFTALRDSELVCLAADKAQTRLRKDADVLAEVARAALGGMSVLKPDDRRKGAILGFVAVCDSIAMRAFIENLARTMRAMGARVAVLGAESVDCPASVLSRLEQDHDYVLMAAERQDVDFTNYCGRQIDRLILVGGAQSPLPDGPFRFAAVAIQRHRLLDFILVQPANARAPANSDRWLSAAPASRLFHVREGSAADLGRLARVYTGRSVGLVLSGGGARAYAHVGAVKALRELRIPIDFIAGTSMGAIIAAGVAMDWSDAEIDERVRDAFVTSSPLADIAFPLLAMTRGREVERRLDKHFGEVEISDLWRPFTCISADLTTGGPRAHGRGLLKSALRASLSLPGVLPPVVMDGHVLVDGSLVRNLPTDFLRGQHDGVTIGIDVAQSAGLRPEDLMLRPSGWRWLTSGAWRRGPPIVSVLMRSATMPAAPAMAASRDTLDVAILPELAGIELRDWKAYAPAVEAGYRATMAQAELLADRLQWRAPH